MSVDLHLHTVHSDGSWLPADLVERAVQLQLSHIAVTDHDTTAAVDEARAAAGGRLEVITGVEINTVWTRPDGSVTDVHLLGYYFDAGNKSLQDLLARQRNARLDFVSDTIESVRAAGVELTFEQVQRHAGRGSVGRPHIIRAIVEAGGADDVDAAWEKFMTRTSPYYVERRSVRPQEAVEVLARAGSVTSIAHPGKEEALVPLIEELKPLGLCALEAYHRGHDLATVRRLLHVAAQSDLVVSGGSDCHGAYNEYPAAIGTVLVPLDVVRGLQARVPVLGH